MNPPAVQSNVQQLLKDYAVNRSDSAFKALVELYVGLVYSACLRQLKDRHLAEDATQAVFLLLSQKISVLPHDRLAGWLLTTSRYACANIRKSEQRRKRREQVVAMNRNTTTQETTDDLLDLLDQALCHLNAHDREPLVLRYLKEQPLDDIAATLGISQAASRKRIDRGMLKLRSYFSRRGMTSTSATLGTVLAQQISGASIAPLARQSIVEGILHVCHAGAHGAAASVAIAKATNIMILFNKIKITAAAFIAAAVIGTSGWMISRAMADRSPLPRSGSFRAAPAAVPMATPPSPAAPATSPATPAVQLAADLTTPGAALNSFFAAVGAGDRDAAYQCLTTDPNRTPTLTDAMLDWNLAQNRLTHAAAKAFGDEGASVRKHLTIDAVALFVGQSPDARIDGNSATITLAIPPSVMNMAPANYQPVLRAWSNAILHFQKHADQWKFDLDQSMRAQIELRVRPPAMADSLAQVQIMTDNARSYDQIAAEIQNGQIATTADASQALNTAASVVAAKHGITFMQLKILPVDVAR